MADFKSEQIRNLSIIGHGGVGKTILTEAVLYTTGVITRFGKIEEGNTVSDYHKDEICFKGYRYFYSDGRCI